MEKESYKLFKALGNSKRLKIITILLKNPTLSVEAISNKIDLSYKSTSKHLLLLEGNGLIKRRQKSWWGFYSIVESKKNKIKHILKTAEDVL